jgi:deoxyribodipyrimidine photo-lyase
VQKSPLIIVWYKRDLRVSDHRPLSEALIIGNRQSIPVIALYVFEPRVTRAPDFSMFHRQFIEESLVDLSKSLDTIGVLLLIFERHISDVMKLILGQYDIIHLFSHEETGNSITYDRDLLMKQYLRSKSISWSEYPTNGVVRALRSRDDWSKIWESRMKDPIIRRPHGQSRYIPTLLSDNWHSITHRNISLQQ